MVDRLEKKTRMVEGLIKFLEDSRLEPEKLSNFLANAGTAAIKQKTKAISIAARPQITVRDLLETIAPDYLVKLAESGMENEVLESAEIRIKYEGYIQREKIIAEKIKRLDRVRIPADIDYSELLSISTEGRQKLARINPETIGQAGRISGVSPSDVNILLMYLGR